MNTRPDTHEGQVASAVASPYKIVHGAVALDPRVQNGRSGEARHHDNGIAAYGESDREKAERKQAERELSGITSTAANAILISAAAANADQFTRPSWEAFDWSAPVVQQPARLVRDTKTGEALHLDDGLTCKFVPESTSSVAKISDDLASKSILNPKSSKGAFNTIADIETYRPHDVPASMVGFSPYSLRDPASLSFAEKAGIKDSFIPLGGLEAMPLTGAFNAPAQKGPKPAPARLELVDLPELKDFSLNAPALTPTGT